MDVKRFRNIDNSIQSKIFTKNEIAYCKSKANPEESFAARFAGKEAIIKALSSLNINKGLKDIEILSRNNKPYVDLLGVDIKLSLSHEKTYALAFVLIEKT